LASAPEIDEPESTLSTNDKTQNTSGYTSGELSCFIRVDDDDNEYGYENDDEEKDCKKVQRKSSLRAVRHDSSGSEQSSCMSPEGGMSKKAVKFSDAMGLSLADVRDLMDSDEPPAIPASALRDLHIRRRRSKTEGKFNLAFDFEQPGSRFDFVMQMLERKVILENCMVSDRDLTVSGLVRVYSISGGKRVSIRYTTDSWITQNDIQANYMPNSSDGTSERFIFTVHLPDAFGLADARQGCSSRVEFAICYEVGGAMYWDSNGGQNYVVYCRLCSST
jgi:protein phosphatase 1 regulatory subunit 3A/B/C/D/E